MKPPRPIIGSNEIPKGLPCKMTHTSKDYSFKTFGQYKIPTTSNIRGVRRTVPGSGD